MKGGRVKRKQAGLAMLILLAALLVAVPAVAGCGGGGNGGEGEKTILIGIMADFTGTAGSAMQPTIKATEDYLTKVVPASDNPFDGVKVKFTRFNTELKYEKVTGGYEELKARGVDMMIIMNAQDTGLLGDRLEGMPVIGTMGLQSNLASEWAITTWSPIQTQGEVEMLFIMEDWDYEGEGRSPKVGHLGYDLVSSEYYQEGIDKVRNDPAYAGKFTWGGFEVGPLGNTTWTSEVGRLKSCDYTIVSVAGPMLSSYVAQARAAGYTGKFLTGMEGFPGFWPLVTDQIGSMDQLYGCYYVAWWPWWNEDVPVIQDCRDYVMATYEGEDEEELLGTSSVISGWELGMAVEMAIRNAVEEVGAENIDKEALRDGLFAIDVQLTGYINKWQSSKGCNNALQWKQRVFEYSVSEERWLPLEGIYEPVLTKPAC